MTIFLTKEHFVKINKETIKMHGGNFMIPSNYLHESNLDYLVESVNANLFGSPMYPTLADKAGLYCHAIICNHIFTDGNKRTGLAAALQFLNLNGYKLRDEVSNPILTQFILDVATGIVSLDECRAWFAKNIELL